MIKLTHIVLVLLFIFSCNKEKKPTYYTEDQIENIEELIGTWVSVPRWYEKKICFENHVDFSVPPNWIITDRIIFQAQGSCYYISLKDTSKCFFELSDDCSSMMLLRKDDSTICVSFEYFTLFNDEIWLKSYLSDNNFHVFERE